MTINAGTRIGPYEIGAPARCRGMGEVYRARDTRLQSDVAIKIPPETFAGDAERRARFEREAQVLAALNHPHIAQITHERGIYPLWSRDGRELLYTPPGELHSVTITTQPSFVAGRPTSLPREFLVNGTGTPRSYELTPDGRFVGVVDAALGGGGLAAQQVLVLNWTEELNQRVPTP